jgi:hypothetical protein
MKNLFRKTILLALVAALAAASLPMFGVAAAGAEDPSAPPQGGLTNERLEKIWARQLRAYEKFGKAEDFVQKAQGLIDRASENGKDVSAVQAALDAFEDAFKDAKPIHASANGIVNSHQGFDSDGKVTDPEKAKETVRQMGGKLKEIREAMNGTGKALHDAIQAFREANPRPEKTPTP